MPKLIIKRRKGAPEIRQVFDLAGLNEALRQMGKKDQVSFDDGDTFLVKKKVTDAGKRKFLEQSLDDEKNVSDGESETKTNGKTRGKAGGSSARQTENMRQIVSHLETRVQRELIGSIEELGKGLTKSLTATSEQLEQLQEELTAQAMETGKAQGDYRKVMETLRRLSEEFESRLTEDALRREIDEYVTNSVTVLQEEVSGKLQALEERYQSLQDKQNRLTVEQEFVEELIDENQETYARYKPGHIEVLQQKIEELENEQVELRKRITHKNEELDARDRRIARLLAEEDLVEREEIQDKLEELVRREKQLGSKEALAAERDQLQERLDELEAQRKTYERHQERRVSARQMKRELEQLKVEKEKLDELLQNVKNDKDRAVSKAQRLERQKNRIQNQLKSEQEKSGTLEIQIDELQAERDALREREDEILAIREENKKRSQALDRRQSEIERERQTELEELLQEKREKLQAEEEQLKLRYQEKRNALRKKLRTELENQFREKVQSLEEEIKRLRPFKSSYDELSREYQNATAKMVQWEKEQEAREVEKTRQESQIEALSERCRKKKAEVDALCDEVRDLDEQRGSLRGEKAQVEAELQKLQERLERRRRQVEAVEESRKAPIYAGIDDFRDCAPMDGVGHGVRAESQWLDGIMESIDEAGFYFPERLVKAFHTSLKIAEWAPLTVLAGVSGTGKSELPRLYSRYGGLHHQLISVKPNWDSPQDLCGFFNYMDNRYKATDFLKALVQSQQSGDDGGFDDQMLLVLLDEMNLARVELYFSDFLSKLEKRRGVNKDEIPTIGVDIGSGIKKEVQVPLGKNVLFVGTMNEDETTKSLSDKVIDRGNVISFPRPKNLHGRDQQELPDGCDERLPKTTWESWIVHPKDGLSEEVRGEIKDAMNRVNKSLRKVNRAIGHRVLQAIEHYVANHPDVRGTDHKSDDAWRTALEDQIAQKIMPKLRGVETDTKAGRDCLRGVRDVLGECAPGLVEDFDQARKAGYGAFRWSSADYLEEDQ